MPTEPKSAEAKEPKAKKAAAPKATTTRAPRAKKVAAEAAAPAAAQELQAMTKENVIQAVGRRKTAIARVRLVRGGKGNIRVNDKAFEVYFPTFELQRLVLEPLRAVSMEKSFDVSVRTQGGGAHAQAESVRLGVSRALIKEQPDLRSTLKKLGYLTRDPRAKERKKPGLRRARRAPQWSKR
jgi:small subunit ribosomal protein S9